LTSASGDTKLISAVTFLVAPDRVGQLLIEIALAGGGKSIRVTVTDENDHILLTRLMAGRKGGLGRGDDAGVVGSGPTHGTRRLMEARMGNAGRREFIQVLRLMEDFHQHQVEHAVAQALRLGAISFDAVKMLLLARLENRPARLDLTFYPYLPAATVGTTDPRAYLGLIASSGSIPVTAGVPA
jgi:hypothetical protein